MMFREMNGVQCENNTKHKIHCVGDIQNVQIQQSEHTVTIRL